MASLLQRFFDEQLALHPSFGSFLGFREYDGMYENTLGSSYLQREKSLHRKYGKLLSENGRHTVDDFILQYILNEFHESLKFPLDNIPVTSFENSYIDFTFMNKTMYPLQTKQDLLNLMRRHEVFMQYMLTSMHKMRQGIKSNITLPKLICEKVINSLNEFIETKSFFIPVPKNMTCKKTTAAYMSMMKVYENKLRKLLDFLRDEYYPQCRSTNGMCHLPNGKQMYHHLIKSQTTLPLTAEYVHKLGKNEVHRICTEIDKLKTQLGFESRTSLQTVYTNMLSGHTFNTKKEVMSSFVSKQKEIRSQVIPRYFHDHVKPYKLARVPVSLEGTSAGAFYYPPSMDSKRPGTFYINLRNPQENPRYSVTALSLHEGEPGHHYQYQYMIDKKVPIHKIYSINGNSFVEGWALYAESLGNYKNHPIDYFGKLTYEMFRAVRLVVDTGIHHYGWTYKKAVNYMIKYVAMTRTEIETEVQRYICLPAQALCYKIGELQIHKLRDQYLEKYPHGIKEFHRIVLEDGNIPLTVLSDKVKKELNK